MNELALKIYKSLDEEMLNIELQNVSSEDFLYKYMVGFEGTWKTIKDFCKDTKANIKLNERGTYIVMVQGKDKYSDKPFDIHVKEEFVYGEKENKLINDIIYNKKACVGEKIVITAYGKPLLLYKFLVEEGDDWAIAKDFSADNILEYIPKEAGEKNFILQCKKVDSDNLYDYEEKFSIDVNSYKKPEIIDFKLLTDDIEVDKELIFEVNAKYDDSRTILYKFIKINDKGKMECVQNYSTRKMVSFSERMSGHYKLLCLLKDMYSPNQYDDRAIFNYSIIPYKDIEITSFTTDLTSPQMVDTQIELKALVRGGRDLRYRYIIEGEENIDSGYKISSSYIWTAKKPGVYKITLMVRDVTYEGEYEGITSMEYVVDKKAQDPVQIEDIITDKRHSLLVGDGIKITALAKGGLELKYSFGVYKDGKSVEITDYRNDNWVVFIPEEEGTYEIDICVKDKYSEKEFDCHKTIDIKAYKFMPGIIEHILVPPKEYYLPGENIFIEVITEHSREIVLSYEIKIDGITVENTGYGRKDKFLITPRRSGVYTLIVYSKNENSTNTFDDKKMVNFKVIEANPITNTKLTCDKTKININEPAIFSIKCDGGKDVVYEFLIMKDGEWNLVQEYSKQNQYAFIPFSGGKFRVLGLCKSYFKNCAYEGYDLLEFTVE